MPGSPIKIGAFNTLSAMSIIFSIGLIILNIVLAIVSNILSAAFMVFITTNIFNIASLIPLRVSLAPSSLFLILL